MENIISDINNFINAIASSELSNFIVIAFIIAVIFWFIKAGMPIYKEFALKYNPIISMMLAAMAAFIDLVYPNTYRTRTAQDIIIQFGMVIVAIIFACILLALIMSNFDVLSKMISGN